ncbi:c-type cytochrome [Humitalea sp. 24SJ18S-53]|uniref:c-type cytochrome n=1 Tax=Humitalea sp. 24SJ18S-53 TaxID=3422307 RepID=UPI003D667BB3
MRTATLLVAGIFAVGVVALFARHPVTPGGRGGPPPQSRPAPSIGLAPAPAPMQAAAAPPAWQVPDPDALPDTPFARSVRHGRDLIAKTSSLIGPDNADPARRFAGNGLDCQSCHLQAGTQQFALPLAGIWGVFPEFIGREGEVRTLEDRINGCMQRSMNGRALAPDGDEMKAMLSYIRFISGDERVGQSLTGRGSPVLPLPSRAADPEKGRAVHAASCAVCHGDDGQGQRLDAAEAATAGRRYRFPPLWGPDSYNDGAGMGRVITAARFVHANMPMGTTFETPQISAEDAFDVMAFINSQPRPHMAGTEADYPNHALKPVDAGYPPFIGPFPAAQHRFGPWQPILDWLRDNPRAN